MSITESSYGERWFDFDRSMGLKLEKENQERQYNLYRNNGGTMSFDEYLQDGRYDRHDWGNAEPNKETERNG